MSLKDDLIAAKALIDAPEKWCKSPGLVHRATGTAYCAWFAIQEQPAPIACCNALVKALPWYVWFFSAGSDAALIKFNDSPRRTHADIMALFDRAIAAAGDA